MAVEAKRGCGYRKIGGIYLVASGEGFPCGRLPIPLVECPTCGHQPPWSEGFQKVKPTQFIHSASACKNPHAPEICQNTCPFQSAFGAETGGLLWIGKGFYTPASFSLEAQQMGISRRISSVPKWFKLGETWVYMAHLETFTNDCDCHKDTEDGKPKTDCETCGGDGTYKAPGIFSAFKPERIELIIPSTMLAEERAALEEKGFTLVEVPWDDPDHQPNPREK